MTFLEAAIEVLRQHGRPLSVRELTERAIHGNLLSHTGRAPEETMRSRLAQEVKKGERTPLVQKGAGIFGLRRYDVPKAERREPAERREKVAEKSADKPEPAKRSHAESAAPATDDAGKKRRRRRGGRGRKRGGAGEGEGTVAAESPSPEAGTPEEAIVAEQLALEAEARPDLADAEPPSGIAAAVSPMPAVAAEVSPVPRLSAAASPPAAAISPSPDHGAVLDALSPPSPRRYPRVVDLPTDEVLSEQYADEVAEGGVIPPVAGEMVDEQTADEDRPMLAEIKEERDRRGRGRRERDAKRKEKPDKHGKRGRDKAAATPAVPVPPAAPLPTPAPPPPPAPVPVPAAATVSAPPPPPAPRPSPSEVGAEARKDTDKDTDMASIALAMLRSLNDPRPVHARQLAAMALKRKLLAGDPEELWRAIRSAIAGDARLRQAQGLRIRARHQGGGLITLTTARLEAEVRAAEEALEARWQDLARTTAQALVARAARLPLAALEQLARIYLDHAGLRDVARVKRAGETWYLAATQRRGARALRLLVSVRAGGGECGRNAVGELRAGVVAKGFDEGLLLAPARLVGEGLRELEAAGPPVVAYTGESFADELIAKGVGVVRANLPLAYLDIDLLAELGEA